MNWDDMLSCITGAIFDFDGTLVNSMPDWAGKMLYLLNTHHIAYPADIIRTVTPLGDVGAAEYFRQNLGLSLSVEQIRAELDAYALPKYRDTIQPKEAAEQLLLRLKRAGVKSCILTASPQHMMRPCLERCGLADYFEFNWCCDDLGLKKTQPEIYARTCAQLGTVPGKTLFFDDNIYALRTARAAGLVTVGVYDESSAGDEQEIRSLTDCYIRSFSQLV